MQVLLCEPKTNKSARLRALLDKAEAEVSVVETLEDARLAMDRATYELVLCSWFEEFAVQGGNVREILPQRIHPCHRVVCLTERNDCEIQEAAYQAGFKDCLFYDLSEAELHEKLEQAKNIKLLHDQLAQANKLESIGELAAGIAHEINTPIQYVGDNTRFVQSACKDLTAILEVCQSLIGRVDHPADLTTTTLQLQETMDDADVQYLIEEIPTAIRQSLEGVDRVAKIVRAMKEFAHPGVSEMIPTDIAKAIENTVMVARNEWKYVAELETEFDANLPLVPCLPGELNQVLLNIIVNAAHAIGESLGESERQKGMIRVSTALVKPFAEIRISDTGGGIPRENLERIFKPFFTTKSAGKGTGQGLAIAHSVIVEKHGGTIQVESEVGEGTTFVIRIPLKGVSHAVEESSQEPKLVAPNPSGDLL